MQVQGDGGEGLVFSDEIDTKDWSVREDAVERLHFLEDRLPCSVHVVYM